MACAPRLETAQSDCDLAVFCVASTSLAVREALRAVLLHPMMEHLSDDARGHIELVLAEAMNNVVEHAYDCADGKIELRLLRDQGQLLCEVVDSGVAMPDGQLPIGAAQQLGRECDLPEGGFGWFLIRSLTENLAYKRSDARNYLSFQLKLEQ